MTSDEGDTGSEPGARRPPEAGDAELREALREVAPDLPSRLETDADDIEQGVAKLVLTLVEFIRQVLEHQAIRRMEGESLSDEELERLGLALMRLEERLTEIREVFGLAEEDLNVDLGPLGRLL